MFKLRRNTRIHLFLHRYEEIEREAVLGDGLRLSKEHLQPAPAATAVMCQRLVAAGPGASLGETVGDKIHSVGTSKQSIRNEAIQREYTVRGLKVITYLRRRAGGKLQQPCC